MRLNRWQRQAGWYRVELNGVVAVGQERTPLTRDGGEFDLLLSGGAFRFGPKRNIALCLLRHAAAPRFKLYPRGVSLYRGAIPVKIQVRVRESKIRKRERMPNSSLWGVYQMAVSGKVSAAHAVCEQHEWDAMEAGSPGRHKLIRQGISSETEAEALARSGSAALATAKDAELNAVKAARSIERARAGLLLTR